MAFYLWTHHPLHSMWWPRVLVLVAGARNLFSKMWLWMSTFLVAPSRTSGKASYFFIQGWGGFCWKHLLSSAAWGKWQHLRQVIEQEAWERRVWKRNMYGNRAFQSFHVCQEIKKAKLETNTWKRFWEDYAFISCWPSGSASRNEAKAELSTVWLSVKECPDRSNLQRPGEYYFLLKKKILLDFLCWLLAFKVTVKISAVQSAKGT